MCDFTALSSPQKFNFKNIVKLELMLLIRFHPLKSSILSLPNFRILNYN